MKRIQALLRETWWLWLLLYGGCWALARYVQPASIVTLPMLTFVFFYFAFVRFDEDGISRDE